MSTAGAMESRAMSSTDVLQTCPGKQSTTKQWRSDQTNAELTYMMFDSVSNGNCGSTGYQGKARIGGERLRRSLL